MNEQKQQIIYLAENLIDPNPRQPRKEFSEEADYNLCQSIKEHGILLPLMVREAANGRYQLIAGERRLRQGRRAGLKKVPCIPSTTDDLTAGEIAIIENELRENLSPLELGVAIEEMMIARGLNGAEAGARLNISPARVSRALALLKLPEAIRAKVASGEISPAKGYELSKIDDPARQQELAAKAASGATRDEIAGARRSRSAPEGTAPFARITAKLAGGRAVVVVAAIPTLEEFLQVMEEVTVRARKARTQGMGVTTFVKMMADQAAQGR